MTKDLYTITPQNIWGSRKNPSHSEGIRLMIDGSFLKVTLLLCGMFLVLMLPMTVSAQQTSKLIWEKEFNPVKFINPEVTERIFECEDSFYIFYYGSDLNTLDTVDGKIIGSYPALLKIDNNGNTIFQNETTIPLIDSLIIEGLLGRRKVRGFKCINNDILFDIPQGINNSVFPYIYYFAKQNGKLNKIEGIQESNNQAWPQTLNSIMTDNELFVISNSFILNNKNYIEVNSLTSDDNNSLLKYRILLNTDKFKDSVLDITTYPRDFIIYDSNSFVMIIQGKNKQSIIAKYSYDKQAASNLGTGETINADLDWHTFYSTGNEAGFNHFLLNENGNIFIYNQNKSVVIIDNFGEIIFFDKIFKDEKYKNYGIFNFMKLNYKSGYYAFWGNYNDDTNHKFAVIITDSYWNVVDTIVWDYDDKRNLLLDIKEKENGNLITLGKSLYKDTITNKSFYKYTYAEIRPDYLTSVEDEKGKSQELTISPMPSSDYIQISGIENGEKIEIFDVLGNIAMETKYNGRINIGALPIGVYYIQAGSQRTKFIKGY
jgi:hypothetical protein